MSFYNYKSAEKLLAGRNESNKFDEFVMAMRPDVLLEDALYSDFLIAALEVQAQTGTPLPVATRYAIEMAGRFIATGRFNGPATFFFQLAFSKSDYTSQGADAIGKRASNITGLSLGNDLESRAEKERQLRERKERAMRNDDGRHYHVAQQRQHAFVLAACDTIGGWVRYVAICSFLRGVQAQRPYNRAYEKRQVISPRMMIPVATLGLWGLVTLISSIFSEGFGPIAKATGIATGIVAVLCGIYMGIKWTFKTLIKKAFKKDLELPESLQPIVWFAERGIPTILFALIWLVLNSEFRWDARHEQAQRKHDEANMPVTETIVKEYYYFCEVSGDACVIDPVPTVRRDLALAPTRKVNLRISGERMPRDLREQIGEWKVSTKAGLGEFQFKEKVKNVETIHRYFVKVDAGEKFLTPSERAQRADYLRSKHKGYEYNIESNQERVQKYSDQITAIGVPSSSEDKERLEIAKENLARATKHLNEYLDEIKEDEKVMAEWVELTVDRGPEMEKLSNELSILEKRLATAMNPSKDADSREERKLADDQDYRKQKLSELSIKVDEKKAQVSKLKKLIDTENKMPLAK